MSSGAVNREIVYSLVYRVGGMGLGFAAASVLIRKLGAESYGTWAALTSLLAWIQLSDFGVGYALKNRIASSAKPGDMLPLVCGVFQFYGSMAIVVVALFVLFGRYLNIVEGHQTESYILFAGTAVFFPLTIGSAVLQGMRKNSTSSLIIFLQSITWLVCVLLLAWLGTTLVLLSLLSISLVLIAGTVQCAFGMRAMVGRRSEVFAELFNSRNLLLAFPLCAVGFRFILLQLSGVVLFSLGTYLTYSNLSPAEAAKYDILFKLSQVPLTFFNVVVSIYWVEIAKSIGMLDVLALRRKFVRLHQIAGCINILILIISLMLVPSFISIYSGGKIEVTIFEVMAFWVMIAVQISSYVGAVFLNAAEKLNGQIILALVAAALLIPAVLFSYASGMGLSSVPFATAILVFPSLIYCNYSTYHHVIKRNR